MILYTHIQEMLCTVEKSYNAVSFLNAVSYIFYLRETAICL